MKGLFCKKVASYGVIGFLIIGITIFSIKYIYAISPSEYDLNQAVSSLFFLNFIVPLIICAVLLQGCIFFSKMFVRVFCLLGGIYAAIHSIYVLVDVFTVNIFVYSACLIVVCLTFSFPRNLGISLACVVVFIYFLHHPQFMGSLSESTDYSLEISKIVSLVALMCTFISFGILLELFVNKYTIADSTVQHLNTVGEKMALINRRLQDLTKNRGEEAIRHDRLRFTRDLHDSCGYAFTNIIAITDGAVSRGAMDSINTQEIFQRIRNQASKGLKELREVLHLIREIDKLSMKSIDTIYQLKTIFEEVAGVQVSIEWGNIRKDYGPVVNPVLTRIIQEAFANSIRHGQATSILIHLWEFPGELSVTITDNGKGARTIIKGIGLAGMEERLASMGGNLKWSSPEEGGFRLAVTIPFVHIESF
jgi:signal transduction histidine kinase